MSKIYNPYSDDWKDVKKSAKEQQDKWRSMEPVNKKFISDEIKKSEEKDNAEEQAEYDKIYKKIADISTGGGADLSGYLMKSEAEQTYAKKTDIPSSVDAYTKSESDEKYQLKGDYLTESDLDGYAKTEDIPAPVDAYTKAESDEKYQLKGEYLTENDLSGYAKSEDIPDVSGFVTEDDVEQKVSAAIAEVVADADEDFDTLKEIADYIASDKTKAAQIETSISNLQSDVEELDSTKAGKGDSYTKQESDAKYLTSHQDISNLATKDEVAAVEAQIPSVEGLVSQEELTAATQNFATISQVAAVDQKVDAIDLTSYAKKTDIPTVPTKVSELENDANYLTQHQDITNLATKDEVAAVEAQIPSVEGFITSEALEPYAKTADVNEAIALKANIDDVSTSLEEKANTDDVNTALEGKVSATEYNALKARFDYLERYVNDYLALTVEQLEEKNDEIINTLSPEKKTVDILTPMESVVIPEANNNAYTVNVPLEEGSKVELTSNKYAYLNNTSDEPVSVSMGREIPQEESESASNPTLYITGQYENITVENLSISQKDTEINAVKNVTITENTTKPVSLTLSLQDGAVITNDSSVAVTLNNKAVVPQDGEPTDVTVIAPNSTVTISGGKYSTFESTVGDDTLYINKAAHINKLVVKKGNVIVNDWNVEDHIDEIENDTEYTVSPKVIEVTTKSDWSKASSTPAIYEVQNDIETTTRIAPGIFGSSAKIKMNGYTVNCSDANGAFVLRGDSHYIIENGTIDSSAYGIWLAGAGTVELKDMNISAHNHALYIEKPNGKIYTTGNCRFSVKDEDTRYVANYFDSTYTGGWTTGFHFGEGTEFVDFDPMNSMGEPNGPVNLLDEGYHTESYQESGHTIYKVVKDSE